MQNILLPKITGPDIAGAVERGQRLKQNSQTLRANDRKERNILSLDKAKGRFFDGDKSALGDIGRISPADALAVSKIADKISKINNPEQLFKTKELAQQVLGFSAMSKTPELWESGKKELKKLGMPQKEIDWIGSFSEEKRGLISAIYGKYEKTADKKLAEIGVGDGNVQKAFLSPGKQPDLQGEPYQQFAPKGDQNILNKTADANFFTRAAKGFYGATQNQITGEYSALDNETEIKAAELAKLAEGIFRDGGGKIGQNDAYRQAVQILQDQFAAEQGQKKADPAGIMDFMRQQ